MRTPAEHPHRRGLRRAPAAAYLAAAFCALLALAAAPSVARSTTMRARAMQTLRSRGYRNVKLSCTAARGGGHCWWSAVRSGGQCSGALTVSRAHRSEHVAIRLDGCHVRTHPVLTVTRQPPPTTTGGRPVAQPALQLGFNTYTAPRTVTEQREVGAKVSRLFVDWSVVEPSHGTWSWQQSDQQYAELIAAGLHPEIVAFTAPCWARPSTDCSNPYFTGPPDPAYMQDWVTYIHDLAVRYPAAAAIEVWNEPNLDQYFLPRSDPARFTALLKAAYAAIKAVNGSMPVISGGLLLSPPIPGSGQVSGGYGPEQFLTAMYADGAKRSMDALGVHIYPSDYVNGAPATWDPAAMQTWLGQIGTVRSAAGEGSQPIWITEMGVSTATEPGWPAATTPQQQATDMSQMIQIARANPSIRTAIIHGLEDQSLGYSDPDNAVNAGWGIFTSDGTAKPAACAVSRLFAGALSC